MHKRILMYLIVFLLTNKIFGQTPILSSSVNIINFSNNNIDLQIITTFDFGSNSTCPQYYANVQTQKGDTLKIHYLYNCDGLFPLFACNQTDTLIIHNIDTSITHLIHFIPCCYKPSNNDTIKSIFENFIPIYPTQTIEILSNKMFNVYPNPTNSILNITSQLNFEIKKINIFNIVGQMIEQTTNKTIDISKYPTGNYIIEVQTENNYLRQKFTKN